MNSIYEKKVKLEESEMNKFIDLMTLKKYRPHNYTIQNLFIIQMLGIEIRITIIFTSESQLIILI